MVKNIIANFVGRFWSVLSSFIFTPIYINILGFNSYSIISFTLVIAGIMVIIDSGLSATLSREFARVDNTRSDKVKIFNTLEFLFFILILFCIVLVLLFSSYIGSHWLSETSKTHDNIPYLLKIVSFDIGFQLLFRFYLGGLLGLEKQVVANVFQVGWGMLRNGFVVIAIYLSPTLETFFLWQSFSTVSFAIIIGLSVRKYISGSYSLRFGFNRGVIKQVRAFAGGMMIISIVASLNTQVDKLAISNFMPIEYLGYYTIAVSLAIGIIVLVNPISIAFLPRITSLYSDGKYNEASKLFLSINKFVVVIVFSVMANLTFFAKQVVWIWTGNMNIAEKTFLLIPIVSFAYSMLSLQIIPFNIAIANGYTRLNNYLGIASLCITIPSYWIIGKLFGLIGVASIFCFIQTVTTLLYLYFINKKFIKMKKLSDIYIKQMLYPLVLTCLISFLFSRLVGYTQDSRILSLSLVVLSTCAAFIATYLILFFKQEYEHLKYFKKVLNKGGENETVA